MEKLPEERRFSDTDLAKLAEMLTGPVADHIADRMEDHLIQRFYRNLGAGIAGTLGKVMLYAVLGLVALGAAKQNGWVH